MSLFGGVAMGISFTHVLLVVVIVALLFGGGKIANTMKELARGVRHFREGLREEPEQDGLKTATVAETKPRE